MRRRADAIIFQPIFLCRAEFFKLAVKRGVGFEFQLEVVERLAQCRVLELGDCLEVDEFCFGKFGGNFDIAFVKQAVRNQRVD